MAELHFTWAFALKIFCALLMLGIYLFVQKQVRLIESDRKERAEALAAKQPVPAPRIIPRSHYLMIAVAIVFLLVMLALGNQSTL